MAGHLGTSEYEVEAYLTTLFAKMGAACRAEALAAAFRRGLLKGMSGTDEASLSRGTFRTE
jgi:DNA-binding NarL/FixJ family response regulator